MRDARRDLLEQLNSGQWLLLQVLADLEEEQGDAVRAGGWRWLAEQRRWPLEITRVEDAQDGETTIPARKLFE